MRDALLFLYLYTYSLYSIVIYVSLYSLYIFFYSYFSRDRCVDSKDRVSAAEDLYNIYFLQVLHMVKEKWWIWKHS